MGLGGSQRTWPNGESGPIGSELGADGRIEIANFVLIKSGRMPARGPQVAQRPFSGPQPARRTQIAVQVKCGANFVCGSLVPP
jgi:hypothetical protein